MGDLRMGDELASVDGQRSRVRAIFPQGIKQIYRVTFSDGRSAECTGDHLWTVHYRDWDAPRTLTTERVAEMLRTVRYRHRLWIDTPSGQYGHTDAAAAGPLDARGAPRGRQALGQQSRVLDRPAGDAGPVDRARW